MKALISPLEQVENGYRIAQVETDDNTFGVADPLFWTDCPNNCIADTWYFNTDINLCVEIPPYVPTEDDNKSTATSLLAATDWVNQPDVRNPAVNPHLLNGDEFDAYRVAVRQYAVYPVAGNIDWPVKPEEQWSAM